MRVTEIITYDYKFLVLLVVALLVLLIIQVAITVFISRIVAKKCLEDYINKGKMKNEENY